MNRAFTLVELVIVILILGVLAAIAAPKLIDVEAEAREVSVKRALSVLRDAIEDYKSMHGEFPGKTGGQAGLKSDLKPYVRGPFPICQVGNQNSGVKVIGSSSSLSPSGSQGWAYSKATGQLIINHVDYGKW